MASRNRQRETCKLLLNVFAFGITRFSLSPLKFISFTALRTNRVVKSIPEMAAVGTELGIHRSTVGVLQDRLVISRLTVTPTTYRVAHDHSLDTPLASRSWNGHATPKTWAATLLEIQS